MNIVRNCFLFIIAESFIDCFSADTGDMKSYTPLFPAFERILRIADPSLIMAAVKTLWKLLDHCKLTRAFFVPYTFY